LNNISLFFVFSDEPMIVYIDSLFKVVNLQLVAHSQIMNKVAKLLYFVANNLFQSFKVGSQFITVNCLLHLKSFNFAGVYGPTPIRP